MNRVVFVDTRFYKDLNFLDKINLKEGDYAFIPLLDKKHVGEFLGLKRSYEIEFCCKGELDDVDSFIGDAAYSLLERFADVYCSIEIVTPNRTLGETIEAIGSSFSPTASLHWLNIPIKKQDVSSIKGDFISRGREATLDKSGIIFNAVNDFNYNLTKLKSQYGTVTKSDFEKYVYYFAMHFIKNKNIKEFYDLIELVSNEVVVLV